MQSNEWHPSTTLLLRTHPPTLPNTLPRYVGADLSALCREAALGALRAHAAAGSKGAPPTVRAADFERALAVVVPSTQRDVHKPLSRDASWDDIGGLEDVKARLRQVRVGEVWGGSCAVSTLTPNPSVAGN